VLEGLFIIFVVLPYSKKVARSILKQPKIYFYDVGSIEGDQSAKFENAIACALLKRNHYLEDALGATCALHYVRDREKREVDFLTLRDHRPEWLIEAKLSDIDVGQLARFAEVLAPEVKPVLLVRNLRRERHIKNVKVKKGSEWLQELEA
jgi:uncharacterized protein